MKFLLRTLTAILALAVLIIVILVVVKQRGQVSKGPDEPFEQFTVANDGDVLLLPVIFEGKEHLFILDTGSSHTVYDTSLPLGERRKLATANTSSGNKTMEMFDSPKALVGKLNLQAGSLVVGADLSTLQKITGYPIRGIIGMDFLGNHIVQIDFNEGSLSFLRSATKDLGERVAITGTKERPCIIAKVSSLARSEEFIIDTGSNYFGNMKKELLETIAGEGKARQVGSSLAFGFGGIKSYRVWLVESLSIAEFRHRDVIVSPTQDNLLGLGFWANYVVTFDFPKSEMYLKRANRPLQPIDLDMSGLHLLRIDGETVVHSVDDGSAATVSGIRPNDVLQTIAGDNVDQLSMLSIRRRLCSEGKEVSITLTRKNEPIAVTMVLGKMLPAEKAAQK